MALILAHVNIIGLMPGDTHNVEQNDYINGLASAGYISILVEDAPPAKPAADEKVTKPKAA
jgi:hypothetical protein